MKDLTGESFGSLVACYPTEKRKNGYVVWACECTCGSKVSFSSRELLLGKATSCGCQETGIRGNALDLAGKRFGRLTALRPIEERKSYSGVVWECACECGSVIHVTAHSLVSGNTRSCGCLKRNDPAEA